MSGRQDCLALLWQNSVWQTGSPSDWQKQVVGQPEYNWPLAVVVGSCLWLWLQQLLLVLVFLYFVSSSLRMCFQLFEYLWWSLSSIVPHNRELYEVHRRCGWIDWERCWACYTASLVTVLQFTDVTVLQSVPVGRVAPCTVASLAWSVRACPMNKSDLCQAVKAKSMPECDSTAMLYCWSIKGASDRFNHTAKTVIRNYDVGYLSLYATHGIIEVLSSIPQIMSPGECRRDQEIWEVVLIENSKPKITTISRPPTKYQMPTPKSQMTNTLDWIYWSLLFVVCREYLQCRFCIYWDKYKHCTTELIALELNLLQIGYWNRWITNKIGHYLQNAITVEMWY